MKLHSHSSAIIIVWIKLISMQNNQNSPSGRFNLFFQIRTITLFQERAPKGFDFHFLSDSCIHQNLSQQTSNSGFPSSLRWFWNSFKKFFDEPDQCFSTFLGTRNPEFSQKINEAQNSLEKWETPILFKLIESGICLMWSLATYNFLNVIKLIQIDPVSNNSH